MRGGTRLGFALGEPLDRSNTGPINIVHSVIKATQRNSIWLDRPFRGKVPSAFDRKRRAARPPPGHPFPNTLPDQSLNAPLRRKGRTGQAGVGFNS